MKKINEISNMPQMGAAFSGWQTSVTITKITQEVVKGLLTSTEVDYTFKGVVQPLNPKSIELKPEGQRAFTWLQIHCFSGNLNLIPNDRIIYNGVTYKVMDIWDYSLNNFIEYHIIQDYEN